MISNELIDMYQCSFVCTLDIFSMDLYQVQICAQYFTVVTSTQKKLYQATTKLF